MMLSGGYIVSALFLNQLKQHLAVKKKKKTTRGKKTAQFSITMVKTWIVLSCIETLMLLVARLTNLSDTTQAAVVEQDDGNTGHCLPVLQAPR